MYRNDPKNKFRAYKYRAKRRKIKFELGTDEFTMLVTNECIYCGATKDIGVDRIDCRRGYVIDNCVSCCSMCNFFKRTYTKNKFINHVKRIYEHLELNK